ncbi:MAG TPA: M20/M25/M40 family metallo-hydrolase, partial [Sphingomicrobium sp.]|nr:M20/M25/M40 family metallo-hydrolase [Sphingomicrobium sp.]
MRFFAVALLAIAATAAAQSPSAVDQDIARRVRADVEFLASDHLEGRDTGSRGYLIAADYVAAQFRAIGLEPAGDNGSWYQQVPFRRASYDKQPVLTMAIGGRQVTLDPAKDATVRPSVTEKLRDISAGFVFVGYGIRDARHNIDDYRGLDLRGKIAVALGGTPKGLPSDIQAHLASSKDRFAAAAGAVGFVELPRNDGQRSSSVARGGRALIDWVDGGGRAGSVPPGMRLQLSLSGEWAARLFEGAAKSLDAVRKEAKANSRVGPRGFALHPQLNVRAESKWEDFKSPEVVGVLKGSDPALAPQHVVLMGHLDHLGIRTDAKPGEDAIYNGALDNAAGVATMLEAARQFAAQPVRPKRSILFIANTGEERGLLGADYYANHPTVPAQSIVGLVDLDMPLLLYPFTDVTAFGAEHSTVGAVVAEAGRSMGIAVSPDPMPEEAIFTRSDHYMFVRRGVPAVLLMTG